MESPRSIYKSELFLMAPIIRTLPLRRPLLELPRTRYLRLPSKFALHIFFLQTVLISFQHRDAC